MVSFLLFFLLLFLFLHPFQTRSNFYQTLTSDDIKYFHNSKIWIPWTIWPVKIIQMVSCCMITIHLCGLLNSNAVTVDINGSILPPIFDTVLLTSTPGTFVLTFFSQVVTTSLLSASFTSLALFQVGRCAEPQGWRSKAPSGGLCQPLH